MMILMLWLILVMIGFIGAVVIYRLVCIQQVVEKNAADEQRAKALTWR